MNGVNGVSSLDILSDQDLIEVYEKAIQYQLETRFINTLYLELERRGLVVAIV